MTNALTTTEELLKKYPRSERLIVRDWVCHDPRVKSIWFTGYFSSTEPRLPRLRLELLFHDGGRHGIDQKIIEGLDGDLQELMVAKAEEWLKSGAAPAYPITSEAQLY